MVEEFVQKLRRDESRRYSRSRSPVYNHKRRANDGKRRSHEHEKGREKREYVSRKYSRSPSIDYDHERTQAARYVRRYSRNRSPIRISPTSELYTSRHQTEPCNRRVTLKEDDRPGTPEPEICTHYLQGRCLYGEKCFKIHLEPEERSQQGGDLRQRLIRKF